MKRLFALLVIMLMVLMSPSAVQARPKEDDGPVRAVITFAKNRSAPDASTITWRLDRRKNGHWVSVESQTWRAGAGMLGKRGKNECIKNVGW
ncbi:MAG: hypothetical protein KDB38_06500, partial [Nocardioidaceae bacterium]|nr:hypothetical protein [Nocardioidaceae bacterium]